MTRYDCAQRVAVVRRQWLAWLGVGLGFGVGFGFGFGFGLELGFGFGFWFGFGLGLEFGLGFGQWLTCRTLVSTYYSFTQYVRSELDVRSK